MKLYVAAHSQEEAKIVTKNLLDAGHTTTSRWVDNVFGETENYLECDRRRIAKEDADDVLAADALVLIACDGKVPGGKFVEAGIAIGNEMAVYLIGRRENMLMWHESVIQFNTCKELVEFLN